MEIKKTPRADLENKKSIFCLLGLVVALGFLYIVFEWTEAGVKAYEVTQATEDAAEEEEEEQIPDYPVTVFVSREGYLKKITAQSLRMSGEQKFKITPLRHHRHHRKLRLHHRQHQPKTLRRLITLKKLKI